MLRDTALFIDVMELLKMVGVSKTKCFKKAFEGLVDGLVYDLVTEYGIRDNNYETDKLIVDLDIWVNSKTVYARKTKTTLTVKSRFFAKLSLKKEIVQKKYQKNLKRDIYIVKIVRVKYISF